MLLQEAIDDVRTKHIGYASLIVLPPGDILVRIGPEEVAEEALVGNLNGSRGVVQLLITLKLRTKPTMHTNNLLLNHRTHRHRIKHIRKHLPQLQIILPLTYNPS